MKKSILIPAIIVICLSLFITVTINLPGQASNNNIRLKVMGQTEFLAGGPASLRIIALDEITLAPMEDVESTIKLITGDTEKNLLSGKTDNTGSMEANFTIPSDVEGTATLKIIATTKTSEEEVTLDVNIKKTYQLLLTTDKPLYQPAQTIHLRLLALSEGTMAPVKNETVTFEIEDGKGNKVFKDCVELSDFGVAATDFTLADEVNMGQYKVKASLEKANTEKTVTVKRYVLPKFNNTVTTEKDYYQPGETLRGTVSSQYFFGKPVTEGEVKITLSTFDVEVTELSEINGITDKDGLYNFEYTLPEYFTGLPLEGGKAFIDMEISVTDNARHQELTYRSLPVVQQPIQITVIPESADILPDVDNIIYVLTSYPDGSPAETDLKITVNEKKEEIKTDKMGFAEFTVNTLDFSADKLSLDCKIISSDDKGNKAETGITFQPDPSKENILLRTDKALYRVGEFIDLKVLSTEKKGTAYIDIIRDGQTILTKSLKINNGKGSLNWSLTPDTTGSLTLHAYRLTPDGQIIRDSRKIFVSPSNDLNIDISMDKGTYLPGEESEITFKVVDKNGKPAISVIGVDIVDESLFALAERKPGFEKLYFLLEEELLEPKYEIHGIEFSEIVKRFDEGENIKNDQNLSQLILKDAPKNDPFTIVIDSYTEKLKNLYRNFNTVYNGMYSYYYAENKYPEEVSLIIEKEYVKEDDALDPWGNLLYIEGGGTVNYPQLISFGPDRKKGTDDDIDYNNIYSILEKQIPYSDPFWNEMWVFGLNEGVLRVQGEDEMGAVPANLASGGALPSAVNHAPAPSDDSMGDAPARVREYFPETLYTNPEVFTDEKGMAKINVTMADSITTWRLTTFASSLTGEMGNKEGGITVFQDFFVDIDLPVFLTQDDEISIPVAVYNYLPGKQSVKIEILEEDWFKLLDVSEKKIDLEKDQVSVVYFRIKALNVGVQPLTVYAKGTEMSDAIKRTVEIVPNGKLFISTESDRLTKSFVKTIDIPEKAIPGASKILVTLYPGLFSQVVEGLDKILRMPSGCFEQTSATTYPNILVLDYLRRMEKITPEMEMTAETYINNGYQRLLTFEVSGGGFSWFGDAPANKLLTAFGLMEFKDMAKVHDIDPALIKRTQDWLVSMQESDGSWKPDESYLHAESWSRLQNSNILVTAYITWALLDTGYENRDVLEIAVKYIKEHYEEADDPYMLSVIANALAAYSPSDPVLKEVFDKLLDMKKEGDGTVYWESNLESITYSTGISSSIETTSMVACAMMKSDSNHDTVNKCITFLIKNKDSYGTWYSTQPTILALKTLLLAAEKAQDDVSVSGSILINGEKFKDFDITSENFDIYQQFDLGEFTEEGKNEVEIKFEGKGNCLYQIVSKYYLPWTMVEETEIPEALNIEVSYDKTKMEQNDTVTCRAEVTNKTGGDVKMTIIDLGIPPGFSVETEGLEKLLEDKVIQKYSLTGRQVIIYIDEIPAEKSVEISYKLRAKYPLKVQIPRSQVYEYYKPESIGTTEPMEMIVE